MRQADLADLAWDLADELAPALPSETRVGLFSALGAGEHHRAIETALGECDAARVQLRDDLADRVHAWIASYFDAAAAAAEGQRLSVVIGAKRHRPEVVSATDSARSAQTFRPLRVGIREGARFR